MKRKLIYGLLALLISFGLWLYVVTVVNPEWEDTFYNIPVVLENEEALVERGLMLVETEKPTVTLRLSGNRTDMIKLNSSNITIKADLSRIYSAGEQSLNYSIIYPGDVPSNAFKIISQTPQYLTLEIVEWKSKEVDVLVDTMETEVPENYTAFKAEEVLEYEKITISGPKDVIDRVASAKIQVSLKDQTETIDRDFDYILCDADGNVVENDLVKSEVEKIHYKLKIQKYKYITLRVEIVDGGGVTAGQCKITQSLETLKIYGSEKQLNELPDELLVGTIDLSAVTADTVTEELPIPLGKEFVGDTMVLVTIELPKGLSTRTELMSNIAIKPLNIPVGLHASFDTTQSIQVTLRGEEAALAAVTPEDLEIQVDFKDATKGSTTYKAKIVVTNPQLAGKVGAVGAYTIEATVQAVTG